MLINHDYLHDLQSHIAHEHRKTRMEAKNMYKPKPIDTSDVALPKELLELTEKIAENVHDVWAVGRIKEGWKFGPVKDGEAKITPLLIPYEELPDSEKEYDRKTALETIKLIKKLGYDVKKMNKI